MYVAGIDFLLKTSMPKMNVTNGKTHHDLYVDKTIFVERGNCRPASSPLSIIPENWGIIPISHTTAIVNIAVETIESVIKIVLSFILLMHNV